MTLWLANVGWPMSQCYQPQCRVTPFNTWGLKTLMHLQAKSCLKIDQT